MATKKSGGSTSLGRDSHGQRLGVKLFAGEKARPGMVLIRQRGTKFCQGKGVRRAGDDTLYAEASGTIAFSQKRVTRFDGTTKRKTIISIV